MSGARREGGQSPRSCFLTLTAVGAIATLLVLLEMDWYLDVSFPGPSSSGISVAIRRLPTDNDSRARPALSIAKPPPLPCGWTPVNFTVTSVRRIPALQCTEHASVVITEAPNVNPSLTSLTDASCLRRFIKESCNNSASRIPRVVHYVRFGEGNVTFDTLVSVAAVTRFIQPCLVVMHSDVMPTGPYWAVLQHLINNIVHVHLEEPKVIHGHQITDPEDRLDIARLRILHDFGGIYVADNQFILQPLDGLYNYSTVMELKDLNCCHGFLLSEPGAPFVQQWLASYADLSTKEKRGAADSTKRPVRMRLEYASMVHVVQSYTPKHLQPRDTLGLLTGRRQQRKHAVYMHQRHNDDPLDMEFRPDKQDSVLGRVVRYVLYADEQKCFDA